MNIQIILEKIQEVIETITTLLPDDKMKHVLWAYLGGSLLASVPFVHWIVAFVVILAILVAYEVATWERNTLIEHGLDLLAGASGLAAGVIIVSGVFS